MNILYISSVCAQTRFDHLVERGLINRQFQNQKFHHLLLKGLSQVEDIRISVVSFYPINRTKGLKLKYEEEEENGIHYVYPDYSNLPVIHHIAKFIRTYQFLKKYRQPDSVVTCNIMNFDECLAALVYRMLHKIKICAITADVPGITSGSGKNVGAWWKKMLRQLVSPVYRSMNNRYDSYLFLSQAMNDVVNTNNKPYIVVEGLSDLSMSGMDNNITNKYNKMTIMYAGGLHREYGIELLVKAFRKIKNHNMELHIYGKGNYEEELKQDVKEDNRIIYFGTRPNSEIVAAQLKAHILVNPRPTNEEFVKYSFPSKIIECMASGTPLLTTHIPSMPDEYLPHVYLFNKETEKGFIEDIERVISYKKESLEEKGLAAKRFILKNKNYRIQSLKLYGLLCRL